MERINIFIITLFWCACIWKRKIEDEKVATKFVHWLAQDYHMLRTRTNFEEKRGWKFKQECQYLNLVSKIILSYNNTIHQKERNAQNPFKMWIERI
jgi:hypothetical protein